MPYIKVNTNKFSSYKAELESARQLLNSVKNSASNIRYELEWDIRYSNNIDSNLSTVNNQLYSEATCITNMQRFLDNAKTVYDAQEEAVKNSETNPHILYNTPFFYIDDENIHIVNHSINKEGAGIVKDRVSDVIAFGAGLHEAGKYTATLDGGKVFLKNFKVGSGLSSQYKYSTWIKKNALDIGPLDVALLAVDAGVRLYGADKRAQSIKNDPNKSEEEKKYDIGATYGCTAAAIGVKVGGEIAGNAVTAAVSLVAGPVVGVVAGIVVENLCDAMADAFTSEEVMNQVSESTANVVGAAKAGCKVVSDKAKEYSEAEGIDRAVKFVEVGATIAVEATKVVATAVVESVKVAAKVVTQTVKNFFKGW